MLYHLLARIKQLLLGMTKTHISLVVTTASTSATTTTMTTNLIAIGDLAMSADISGSVLISHGKVLFLERV